MTNPSGVITSNAMMEKRREEFTDLHRIPITNYMKKNNRHDHDIMIP